MASAGTAIGGFLHVMQLPLGYDPTNVMQLSIRLHVQDLVEGSRIQTREARTAYIEQIKEKIASVAGVSTVAVGGDTMPPYPDAKSSFELDGTSDREQPRARVMLVSHRYFAALRIPLLQGRVWDTEENASGDFKAVVNRVFANRYSPRPMF
jgi:putative ABC transport system permease protein